VSQNILDFARSEVITLKKRCRDLFATDPGAYHIAVRDLHEAEERLRKLERSIEER
jgi:hypothetical protein